MTDAEHETLFRCCSPGLAGTTEVALRQVNEQWEARMGIALFGTTNMDPADIERVADPFSDEWRDNYTSGTGATQEEAIEAMERDYARLYESLWR